MSIAAIVRLTERFADDRQRDRRALLDFAREHYVLFERAATDFLGLFRDTLDDLKNLSLSEDEIVAKFRDKRRAFIDERSRLRTLLSSLSLEIDVSEISILFDEMKNFFFLSAVDVGIPDSQSKIFLEYLEDDAYKSRLSDEISRHGVISHAEQILRSLENSRSSITAKYGQLAAKFSIPDRYQKKHKNG